MKHFPVSVQDVQTDLSLSPCRDVDQPDNPRVRGLAHYCQLSKILVKSDKHAPFSVRPLKDLHVSGVLQPITGPSYIMPFLSQSLLCLAPNTRVQKDLHVPVSWKRGSILSCPTTLRA